MAQEINKSMQVLAGIEQEISKECKGLNMQDPDDRVTMAWWVYQNFVIADLPRIISERRNGETLLLNQNKK